MHSHFTEVHLYSPLCVILNILLPDARVIMLEDGTVSLLRTTFIALPDSKICLQQFLEFIFPSTRLFIPVRSAIHYITWIVKF
jgi:hypothetical protein